MENWRDSLPEGMQANPTLAKYDTVDAAMQGLIDANSRLGRSITIPGEDADDADRTKFYDKLQTAAPNLTIHPDYGDEEHAAEFWKLAGVPADAKGYSTAEGFEGLPNDFIEGLRGTALAAGWTNKQFQATLAEYAKEFEATEQTNQQAMDDDAAVVKGKWGMAEDQKKGSVAALIEKFEDPDHKLGDLNAAAYLLLNNIVEAFTGKGPQVFNQPKGSDAMTPEEIETALTSVDRKLLKSVYGTERKSLLNRKVTLLKMRAA